MWCDKRVIFPFPITIIVMYDNSFFLTNVNIMGLTQDGVSLANIDKVHLHIRGCFCF